MSKPTNERKIQYLKDNYVSNGLVNSKQSDQCPMKSELNLYINNNVLNKVLQKYHSAFSVPKNNNCQLILHEIQALRI